MKKHKQHYQSLLTSGKNYLFMTFCSLALTSHSADFTDDTVGTINGNNRTILQATGNSFTSTQFATDITTAFVKNTGGVWDFEEFFTVDSGEQITLNYGTSLTESLVLDLTIPGGGTIGLNNNAGEATSGVDTMGLNNTADRTFTPNKSLLSVGLFNTDRGDATRIPQLTVTYLDSSTASTSGANAGDWYFHGLSGTEANPITSFTISQNKFVRYDDLGFIAIPEISTLAMFICSIGLFLLIRQRP